MLVSRTSSVSHSSRPFNLPACTLISRLSPPDQADYLRLVHQFNSSEDRNKRNLGMSTFVKHLGMIHSFVCRGDSCDALRGAACGIEFAPNAFLINTRQLKKLMVRSKSCMNGCFQKLGYGVCRPARELQSVFAQILPGCSEQAFTARQWCVRKANDSHSISFTPNVQFDVVSEREGGHNEQVQNDGAWLFDIRNLLNLEHPISDPVGKQLSRGVRPHRR
jgi:hypothetical protein